MTRSQAKNLRSLYWIVTTLFLLGQGWSALQYLTEAPRMTDTFLALGYPLYLMSILAVAKVLGILAIVTSVSPTLKEWAYAGFTFDVCGAFASHLSVHDSLVIALVPAGFFVLQLFSYGCWKQLTRYSAARRRRYLFDAVEAEPQTP